MYDYDNEFGELDYPNYEPTENQINDWNIHNDHQNNNEPDDEDFYYCDNCAAVLIGPDYSDLCTECENAYAKQHPHPLDIAEREFLEDQSAGLEDPWWRRP